MATFVIVHGGWGGGWEWTPVARRLRTQGHEVFTPTLSGLGERAHAGGTIDLSHHIEDVLAVLQFEELHDVMLCGHSYGGMVVTGAADRAPERIRLLVYLDSFVPGAGQSVLDLLPGEFADLMKRSAAERGDGRAGIPDNLLPPEGVIAEDLRARYIARVRPHPLATMTEAITLSGGLGQVRRAFVHCTGPSEEVIVPFAARARRENWPYREVATAHDLQLLDPDGTAAVLDELARTVARREAAAL